MIVDTSALVCISLKEDGFEPILTALLDEGGFLPAPALVEFRRVIWRKGRNVQQDGELLLQELFGAGLRIEGFSPVDGDVASHANGQHGSGNGQGGTLNLLDLMVYAVATRLTLPILCTGRDYAATGIAIHPASRSE